METKSETLFENFLRTNDLHFEKINAAASPRPDNRVPIGDSEIVFVLKELAEDDNFGVISSSRTLGDLRRRLRPAST